MRTKIQFQIVRSGKGWRTPVEADGAGFPDLGLVRGPVGAEPGRVIFAELKRDGGDLTAEQQIWQTAFKDCPGVEYYVWRPRDWPEVEKRLREKG